MDSNSSSSTVQETVPPQQLFCLQVFIKSLSLAEPEIRIRVALSEDISFWFTDVPVAGKGKSALFSSTLPVLRELLHTHPLRIDICAPPKVNGNSAPVLASCELSLEPFVSSTSLALSMFDSDRGFRHFVMPMHDLMV